MKAKATWLLVSTLIAAALLGCGPGSPQGEASKGDPARRVPQEALDKMTPDQRASVEAGQRAADAARQRNEEFYRSKAAEGK
ncbi:MAG: hypothetical protein SNJ74_08580 [Fimbriimonadaceae bacterium]